MMKRTQKSVFAFLFLLLGTTTAAAQTPTPRTIRPYGLAVPKQQVTLRAAVDGRVFELHCEEGDFVKKGDLLVALECRPAQVKHKIAKLAAEGTGTLKSAEAELEFARSNFTRLSKLHRDMASSAREWNQAKLRLKSAEANLKIEQERMVTNRARLELAEAELSEFFLKAPFDGQVVHVQTNPGAPVSETADLIKLVSLDFYRVELFLPVDTAYRLKPGGKVAIQTDAPVKRRIEASVVFCSPLIEAATGTTRVLLEIDNRQLNLPAGFAVSLAPQQPATQTVAHEKKSNESATE